MGLWVDLPYACFWLEVDKELWHVTKAPPIARWTIGKNANLVNTYYKGKGAKTEWV